ncbi:hypothetical protein F6P84_06885 [Streptococcus suis]|nr:hypothetical protein CR542_09930 [Streptococcus suis]MBL1133032.1 hypothetical protein [Streptococcus suis]MBL1156843.1 hypothetical protein [Streptococcus suis]MBO8053695.1 hypothetical protein [Streptococcus suis]MBS8040085.1 hypothetical protein [Streptococcus suis]
MNVRNQVLRKHVKLASSLNVNYQRYINVSKHSQGFPYGCFFLCFLQKFALKFALNLHYSFLRC